MLLYTLHSCRSPIYDCHIGPQHRTQQHQHDLQRVEWGEHEKALHYSDQSLKICTEQGCKKGEVTALNNLSSICPQLKDHDGALRHFQRCLKVL